MTYPQVRRDKTRELAAGHDGTWVAHPGLVPIAREVFGQLATPNQLHRQLPPRSEEELTAELLLRPEGPRTPGGLHQNISVGLRYVEAWLRGLGCVPLFHLMEDAATAEISRTQLWQWVHHAARLDDGTVVTKGLVTEALHGELDALRAELGPGFASGRWTDAADLFLSLVLADELAEFLTVPAYALLND